jgi:hypothetical protein
MRGLVKRFIEAEYTLARGVALNIFTALVVIVVLKLLGIM